MRRRPLQIVLAMVTVSGFLSAAGSLALLPTAASRAYFPELLLLSVGCTLLAWLSRRMPSGVTLNPAVILGTAGVVLLPTTVVMIPVLPALISLTFRGRMPLWRYLLTFGHAGLSLVPSSLLYHAIAPAGLHRLNDMIPGAAAALLAHELIHMAIAAAIVADREGRPYTEQMRLVIRRDWTWGTLGMNLLGMAIATHYMHAIYWGTAGLVVLTVCLYQAVSYFAQVTVWQEAAWTDGLTQVGNRSAWEAYAAALRASPEPPSGTLIMVDVNGLKTLNDEHGHIAGDQALCQLSVLLKSCLRKSDRVFRYGGDEFVVFIPHSQDSDGLVRERITPILERYGHDWPTHGARVSASVGMATMPKEAVTLDELFKLADARMYANKACHREAAGKSTAGD